MSARLKAVAILLLATLVAPPLRAAPVPEAGPRPIAAVKVEHAGPVDFEKEVLPLLNASCLACHSKSKPKAGLVLETPVSIRKGGEDGPAVVPGKPWESLLMKAATHVAPKTVEIMPPAGNKANAKNLTGEQLGLIALWIEQGATGEVRAAAPLAWRPVAESVRAIYAVAISPDGSIAAAGRGNEIDLYDLKAGKLCARLGDVSLGGASERPRSHRDLVQCLAFSPDGKTLASGAYREVKLWNVVEGADWKLLRTIGTGGPDSPLADRVNAIDFAPDGLRIAIGGGVPSRSGQVALANVSTGEVTHAFDDVHSDSVLCLQFSADGTQLVTGSADKFVRLVDAGTGRVIKSFEGHTHHILGVALKRDGKVIASAGADNTLRFWDVESGERRKGGGGGGQQQTFEKEATGVRFVGESDQVIASSGDGKVKLFRDTGNEVKSLTGPSDFMYGVAASADGKTIIAGGQDGVLRVWSLPDGKATASFDR